MPRGYHVQRAHQAQQDQNKPKPLRESLRELWKGEHVTPWTLSSLCLLLVGGLIFMIAFMTNGWGRLTITEEGQDVDYWEFGLWQCCRVSDNSCIGPRWPTFYTTARMCGILAILTNALTFGWLLGYTLEMLLLYDPCTLGSLLGLNAVTVLFNLTTVCLFGIRWPIEFKSELHGTSPELYYAFYMGCMTMTFSIASEVLLALEFYHTRKNWKDAGPQSPTKTAETLQSPEEGISFIDRIRHRLADP